MPEMHGPRPNKYREGHHLGFWQCTTALTLILYDQTMQELQPGLYRHYKGGTYLVIGVASHSETDDLLVVYRCLNDNDGLWVRPLAMFLETVLIDGRMVLRFERYD